MKQKAIRCTEEVVRREETAERERALAAARDEWKKERQELFKEAHQSQLRAIAKHSAILEEKLRNEFAETLMRAQDENRQHLQAMVEATWREAEELKQKAVAEARKEERALAREEAERVAERVVQEKRAAAELAAKEKAHALEELRRHLGNVQESALQDQCRKLERTFEQKLSEESAQYEVKLAELQKQHEEQVAVCQRLEGELEGMTDLKDEWARKHRDLKAAFSDFIDQFPGFRGEFLLK